MKIVEYKAPLLHRQAHISTVLPNLLRPIGPINYQRETIDLPDADFIDVDKTIKNSKKAVLLLHGLEGSSSSQYITGMAHMASQHGFDVLAMNHRGCSGRNNLLARSYHSGATDDVLQVLRHYQSHYDSIDIIGFSLGGNIALKIAGDFASKSDVLFRKVVGISVPIDLQSCATELGRKKNFIYLARFLRSLKMKALDKAKRFPEARLDQLALSKAKSFYEFDEYYTAPVHGFTSAVDYYEKCSSLSVLNKITSPTLLINAQNDTFLGTNCYPSINQDNLTTHYPTHGGHVGFAQDAGMKKPFWSEVYAMQFLTTD